MEETVEGLGRNHKGSRGRGKCVGKKKKSVKWEFRDVAMKENIAVQGPMGGNKEKSEKYERREFGPGENRTIMGGERVLRSLQGVRHGFGNANDA